MTGSRLEEMGFSEVVSVVFMTVFIHLGTIGQEMWGKSIAAIDFGFCDNLARSIFG